MDRWKINECECDCAANYNNLQEVVLSEVYRNSKKLAVFCLVFLFFSFPCQGRCLVGCFGYERGISQHMRA